MALIKFGAGVSEMRGKEGGVIYSRNAYGSYIKTKVSPVNPQSTFQQNNRSSMGNLAQSWNALTAGQKSAWNTLGDQVTRTNRFGDQTTYTGFNLYMRLNRNLAVIGQSAISTAPTPPELPVLTAGTLTATVAGTVLTQAFTPTSPGSGLYLVVYATNNIVTSRKFVKNFYRYIYNASNPSTSPANLYQSWNTRYSNDLIAGATIFTKMKLIDSATGFDGVPDVTSAVVTAS